MARINQSSKELVRQWLMERWESGNPLPEMTRIQRELGWALLPANVPIKEFDLHINDAQFADAVVEQVMAFMRK